MKIVIDGVAIKTDYQTWYEDQIEDAEFEMIEQNGQEQSD